MFHLSFSNRFEILLDTLLDQLGAEQPGPFGQRQVVVPSSALRRTLELVTPHDDLHAGGQILGRADIDRQSEAVQQLRA